MRLIRSIIKSIAARLEATRGQWLSQAEMAWLIEHYACERGIKYARRFPSLAAAYEHRDTSDLRRRWAYEEVFGICCCTQCEPSSSFLDASNPFQTPLYAEQLARVQQRLEKSSEQ